jgi:hypothetical protein
MAYLYRFSLLGQASHLRARANMCGAVSEYRRLSLSHDQLFASFKEA